MTIIGMGIDIIEIKRIGIMSSNRRNRLARRILRSSEWQTYQQHNYPVRFLAKCFTLKEAASKALGIGIRNGVVFTQFEIYNNVLGKPSLRLFEKAAIFANLSGITNTHVSFADEQKYACAMVIFEH